MILCGEDFEINGDSITIKREVLKRWREHYSQVAKEKNSIDWKMYYSGKMDYIGDLLKLFEPITYNDIVDKYGM